MNTKLMFELSNAVVLPFWLLLILVPRQLWAVRIVRSPWIAALPAMFYIALIVPTLIRLGPGIFSAFSSLEGVASLLASPEGAAAAWAHLLAFDLLVGRWVFLDAHERGIRTLIIGPVLFFIFMLGPLGFLAYLVVRSFDILAKRHPSMTPAPATGSAAR